MDGTYYLTADGTAERPIAIEGRRRRRGHLDGNANFALRRARRHYLLKASRSGTPITASSQARSSFSAPKGLSVEHMSLRERRRRHLEQLFAPVTADIADSTFIGRDDPDHVVIGWSGSFWQPFSTASRGEVPARDGIVSCSQGVWSWPSSPHNYGEPSTMEGLTSKRRKIRTGRRRRAVPAIHPSRHGTSASRDRLL